MDYKLVLKGDSVVMQKYDQVWNFKERKWDGYAWKEIYGVATKEEPIVVINTNNIDAQVLRTLLPSLKGAKCIESEVFPNYDIDPYGRRVPKGTTLCQKWDLSGCFK